MMGAARFLITISLILHQCTYTMPRKLDFENVPSLDDVLKTNSLFLELVLNSRLLCGAECSVHVDVCRSYAWNRLSLRCLIYSLKFDSAPVSASTELGWQHYNVKGKNYMYIIIFFCRFVNKFEN